MKYEILGLALAASLGLAPLLASSPAHATIPPSQFILKKIAAKRSDVKSVRVRSMVASVEGDQSIPVRFRDVTIYHAPSRTLRSVAFHETESTVLFVREVKGQRLEPVPAILFDAQLKSLTETIKEAGIPVRSEDELLLMTTEEERRAAEVEHLARYGTSIAWVIGKRDSTDAQLWVEKETFLPLRIVHDGDADIRFDKYRWVKEFPYPRLISLVKREVPVIQAELIEVLVNPDIAELKRAATPGFTAAGNSASGAVKDLITRYYETFR